MILQAVDYEGPETEDAPAETAEATTTENKEVDPAADPSTDVDLERIPWNSGSQGKIGVKFTKLSTFWMQEVATNGASASG